MDLQTYDQATELLNKYRLCETMLEYLSDPEAVKGQKYNEKSGEFFKVFHDEMLAVTHDLMTKCGEQFSDLHCPEHSEQPDTPAPPTEEKEPKFPIDSKVVVVDGIGKGDNGVVKDYNPAVSRYYVVSDNFSMWFAESELEEYVEESEVPPITDTNGFSVGNRIEVISGDRSGEKGLVHDINEDGIYVYLDGEAWLAIYEPSEIKKIDPENPEDNGAGYTDPTEGE